MPMRLIEPGRSMSGTGIVTSSIIDTGFSWKKLVLNSVGCHPAEIWWRLWSWRTTPGFWLGSFTPSSNHPPWNRTLYSKPSLPTPTSTEARTINSKVSFASSHSIPLIISILPMIPTSLPPSTTGTVCTSFSAISVATSFTSVLGVTVIGFRW